MVLFCSVAWSTMFSAALYLSRLKPLAAKSNYNQLDLYAFYLHCIRLYRSTTYKRPLTAGSKAQLRGTAICIWYRIRG